MVLFQFIGYVIWLGMNPFIVNDVGIGFLLNWFWFFNGIDLWHWQNSSCFLGLLVLFNQSLNFINPFCNHIIPYPAEYNFFSLILELNWLLVYYFRLWLNRNFHTRFFPGLNFHFMEYEYKRAKKYKIIGMKNLFHMNKAIILLF